MSEQTSDPAVEQQVEALVERFLEELRAGATPDRQALVAEHPEIAGLLDQCDSGCGLGVGQDIEKSL